MVTGEHADLADLAADHADQAADLADPVTLAHHVVQIADPVDLAMVDVAHVGIIIPALNLAEIIPLAVAHVAQAIVMDAAHAEAAINSAAHKLAVNKVHACR